VLGLLGVVFSLFGDFRYTDHAGAGTWAVLSFQATVAGNALERVDVLRLDGAGRVREFRVMIRPLKALTVLGREVGIRMREVQPDA
jgi:hypothetical protein